MMAHGGGNVNQHQQHQKAAKNIVDRPEKDDGLGTGIKIFQNRQGRRRQRIEKHQPGRLHPR